jgi:peptide/nickel transport system ATP-binding protein/oligopeptide transport system ATP-binding protein
MTLLEAEGLCKTFLRRSVRQGGYEHRAVDDVSFSLDTGSTLAIVGESGAGKSTTARLVLGLVQPDAGSVRLNGTELVGLSRRAMKPIRRSAQMIFQDPHSSFDPRIRIGRSVAEPLKVHFGMNHSDREARALEVLQRVGLSPAHAARLPHQLSGGQLQRAAIARALTLKPELIVCDEAVAALDVSIRAQVLNLLADLQDEQGMSYLFIAHDLAIVETFADFVLVMKDGRVVERGETAELYAHPSDPYTQELLGAIPHPHPPKPLEPIQPERA